MQGIKTNLTGRRFGRLTVLGEAPNRKRGYSLWFVQCDCGSAMKVVISTNLTKTVRGTKSCGCLTRNALGEAARNRIFHDYKNNAKKRGLLWNLADSYFIQLIQSNCHYCGRIPASISHPSESSNGTFTYNGIDRIDNHLGYIDGNVVPCCKICNWAKGKQSHAEFVAWVTDLCQYQLQKQTTNILIREQAFAASAA